MQLEGELQQLSQHADSARTTSSAVRERLGMFQGLLTSQTEAVPATGLLQLQHTMQQQTQTPQAIGVGHGAWTPTDQGVRRPCVCM